MGDPQAALDKLALLGPVRLALLLALLALVPVAWSLQVPLTPWQLTNAGHSGSLDGWAPMTPTHALTLTAIAMGCAALVGGWVGGRLWQWSPLWAVFLTMTLAMAIAVFVLPPAAAALGVPLRVGVVCLTACDATLRSDQPLSGVNGLLGMLVSAWVSAPFGLIALVILLVAVRRRAFTVAVFATVGLHVALQIPVLLWPTGGQLGYPALAVGMVAWGLLMRRRDVRRGWSPPPVDNRLI